VKACNLLECSTFIKIELKIKYAQKIREAIIDLSLNSSRFIFLKFIEIKINIINEEIKLIKKGPIIKDIGTKKSKVKNTEFTDKKL
jgi:hypothetical protein